jgi:hypothetical protein
MTFYFSSSHYIYISLIFISYMNGDYIGKILNNNFSHARLLIDEVEMETSRSNVLNQKYFEMVYYFLIYFNRFSHTVSDRVVY